MLGHISHFISLERYGPKLTDRVFWRTNTNRKVVAISFDDGPNEKHTPPLLDILDRYEVPATFFLIGRYVEKHPRIARRIAGGLHEIGNHTYSHKMLPLFGSEVVKRELSLTHKIISEVTGRPPVFMRPPMGMFSKRILTLAEAQGYKTVIGDVYPRDPGKPGAKTIVNRVLSRVAPGSVIILHDGGNTKRVDRSQTLASVKIILPRLLDAGFEFMTLSNLAKQGGA